ncbi:hypothetical protein [Leucobacter komagatae]|uniref:Uncharacterized protein n=1 Tax=Leucobacter komagatae TaxID=55969 RepID=A0A0D0IQ96_9MICO|nr:hypothetical protein [Leucobacter komagatae]KIP53202.1 hypothetical protein SD72_05200 [Leucobacter komagatae]
MTKHQRKQWWAWAAAAIVVASGVLALWMTPPKVELNGGQNPSVTCASLVRTTSPVSLWPYINEVQGWVEDGHLADETDYVLETIGMIERCGVARQNREVALMLAAIGGATLLIVTRPRSGDGRTAADDTSAARSE